MMMRILAGLCLFSSVACAAEGRSVVPLNGTWQIAESVSPNDVPEAFDHTKWYHVVFVRDGKSVRVYLNSREEPEISGQAEPGCTAEARQLHLGSRDDGFAELDGQVDQVSVYDRVLAPTEISAHYRAANPAPASE